MIRIFCCFVFLFSTIFSFSQEKLEILQGDLVVIYPEDESRTIQKLYKNEDGQAKMNQKETMIEADSIKFNQTQNYAEALGNVFIHQQDSLEIYSHEAYYFGNNEQAKLKGEVALIKGVYTLQTEELEYDFKTEEAYYYNGGELKDTLSTLTSKVGRYNTKKQEAIFRDSVVMVTPDQTIETDKLTYNTEDKWAYFEGKTKITTKDQVIYTDKGKYNTETGKAIIDGNPNIEDENTKFSADKIELAEQGGVGKATGNVQYFDKKSKVNLKANEVEQIDENTIKATGNVDLFSEKDSIQLYSKQMNLIEKNKGTDQEERIFVAEKDVHIISLKDSIELYANKAKVNEITKEFEAYENVQVFMKKENSELLADTLMFSDIDGYGIAKGRPFITAVQEQDSIFMTAKTLEAIRDNETEDSTYNFIANQNFRLFKSDLQAIADSAYVDNQNEIITLLKQPVIWSDSTQMSADTIRIFLLEQEINKVEFRNNCMFINLVDDKLFNQMKGKKMDVYFNNEEIDSLFVDGNAETVFYVKDELEAYVGVDEMKSGQIKATFKDGEMDEVLWLKQQEGTTHPFQNIDPKSFLLNGFAWRESQRPKSKRDILIHSGRIQVAIKPDEILSDEEKINTTKNELFQIIKDSKEEQSKEIIEKSKKILDSKQKQSKKKKTKKQRKKTKN